MLSIVERFDVPDELKKIVINITTTSIKAEKGLFYDKFIPSCNSALVIHFKDTFEFIDKKNISILPITFFIGNFNHHIKLKSIGNIESIVIVMKPYGLYRFFGIDMSVLSQNYHIDASAYINHDLYELLKKSSNQEKIIYICDFLQSTLAKSPVQPDISDDICDYILETKGIEKIDQIAKKYKVNDRYLRRKFIQRIGISPKQLGRTARIIYLITSLDETDKSDWPSLVSKCGYSDQSHLIKDFKAVIGEKPEEFMKRDHQLLNFITFLKTIPN